MTTKKNSVTVFFWAVKDQPNKVDQIAIGIRRIGFVIPTAEGTSLTYDSPPDLAILELDPPSVKTLTKDVGPLPYLKLTQSARAREGDAVAICGFPHGLKLPEDAKRGRNSVVQKGIVSAIMPNPTHSNPSLFVLDILVCRGSSGSPLFNPETGQVLGVVFASKQYWVPVDRTNMTLKIPSFPGYAVPIERCLHAMARYENIPKPPEGDRVPQDKVD